MIADKIKMLRNANNMTQSELARKLNITRSLSLIHISEPTRPY